MGVYIKGMEMPEHCGKCRFSVGGWCYAAKDFDRARITTNSCPLVEVPTPHGRLLDEDVILPKRDKKKGIVYIGNFSEIEAVIEAEG